MGQLQEMLSQAFCVVVMAVCYRSDNLHSDVQDLHSSMDKLLRASNAYELEKEMLLRESNSWIYGTPEVCKDPFGQYRGRPGNEKNWFDCSSSCTSCAGKDWSSSKGCRDSTDCCNADHKYLKGEEMVLNGERGKGRPEACLKNVESVGPCMCGYPKEGDENYDTNGVLQTFRDPAITEAVNRWGLDRSRHLKGECQDGGWSWKVTEQCSVDYFAGSTFKYGGDISASYGIHHAGSMQKKLIDEFARMQWPGMKHIKYSVDREPAYPLREALCDTGIPRDVRAGFLAWGRLEWPNPVEEDACWKKE